MLGYLLLSLVYIFHLKVKNIYLIIGLIYLGMFLKELLNDNHHNNERQAIENKCKCGTWK